MAKKTPKRKRDGASGDGSAVSVDTVVAQISALRTRATDLVRRLAAGEEAVRKALADLAASGDGAAGGAGHRGTRPRATATTARTKATTRRTTTATRARRPRTASAATPRPRRTRTGGS